MGFIRVCVVCKSFTLSLYHCDRLTVNAHPPKYKEKFDSVRERAICGNSGM